LTERGREREKSLSSTIEIEKNDPLSSSPIEDEDEEQRRQIKKIK